MASGETGPTPGSPEPTPGSPAPTPGSAVPTPGSPGELNPVARLLAPGKPGEPGKFVTLNGLDPVTAPAPLSGNGDAAGIEPAEGTAGPDGNVAALSAEGIAAEEMLSGSGGGTGS